MASVDAPRKPVLLHCVASIGPGGMEHALLRTLPRLTAFTHVVCSLGPRGIVGDRLASVGIPVVYLTTPGASPWNLRTIRAFQTVVRTHRPTLLITYLARADLFGSIVGRWLGIPAIVGSLRSTLRDIRYLPLIALTVLTSPLVTRYVAVSNAVRDRFTRCGVSFAKVVVVPNGVDISALEGEASAVSPMAVRQSLHLPPATFVIGVVGRLRRERGQRFVLRALAELRRTRPAIDVHLLCIGDGPERSQLERMASSLGLRDRIRFLGDRTDVPALLRTCDVVVISSLYEGMSNALLESLALGRPTIAIDVPENREVVGADAAILVWPRRPRCMADAIRRVAEDTALRKQLATAARARGAQFTIDATVQGLTEVYYSLTTSATPEQLSGISPRIGACP